jgi:hypothetical protein
MNLKIDRDELLEIVAKMARLEEEDQALLKGQEVRQILREVDLPDTRVEEARRMIAATKEERRAFKRHPLVATAITLAVLVGAGSLALRAGTRRGAG